MATQTAIIRIATGENAVARDRALEQERARVDEEQAGDRPPEDGLRRAFERRDEGGDGASHGFRSAAGVCAA
jgi:hypothetical protein